MTPPIDLYFEQLSAAADRLQNTTFARFKTDLNRYLKTLAAHPLAARAITELESEADLQAWLDDLGDLFTADPPVFPDDARPEAAIRLGLMRRFAKDVEDATEFGIRLSNANDYETLIHAVNDTVFRPLTDDLPDLLLNDIHRLERDGALGENAAPIWITADTEHSSWRNILRVLDAMADALRSTPGAPDRAEGLAELAAGAGLIRSGRLRPLALKALLLTEDGPLRRSTSGSSASALGVEAVRLIENALTEVTDVRS